MVVEIALAYSASSQKVAGISEAACEIQAALPSQ